jgi:outer membrane protein TolC
MHCKAKGKSRVLNLKEAEEREDREEDLKEAQRSVRRRDEEIKAARARHYPERFRV